MNLQGFLNTFKDNLVKSIKVIEHSHHEIHEGDAYVVSRKDDMSINEVLDVRFITADAAVYPHLVISFSCESETDWAIYEDVDVNIAGETNYTPINRNRNSSNVATMRVNSFENADETDANADSDVTGATLLVSGVASSGRGDVDSVTIRREFILKPNTKYMIRFAFVAAGWVDWELDWYEES